MGRYGRKSADANFPDPAATPAVGEAFHGAVDLGEMRRRGIDPDRLLDFSANINPFGPSSRVREAVSNAVLDRYPDRECLRLREALSAQEGIDMERIIIGNGTSELLQLIAQVFLRPHDCVLVVGPTYAEYARASLLSAARVCEVRAVSETGFATPVEAVEDALREWQLPKKIAFICNPNNPTGQVVPRRPLLEWVLSNPSTLFIVDESYIDFAASVASVADAGAPNLIVLRSLTKSYALAGLRLGYAIASREVIGKLCQRRVPWSVSAPAQAAGVAAIEDRVAFRDALERVSEAKHELFERLIAEHLEPVPSDANFFLLRVGDASQVRERLLAEGILVRDCDSFGIPSHIRIGVRTREENAVLLRHLADLSRPPRAAL